MILLLFSVSFTTSPATLADSWISAIYTLLFSIIFVSIVLAALIYVFGHFFGPQVRARFSDWSKSILIALAVSLSTVLILTAFVTSGTFSSRFSNLELLIIELSSIVHTILISLIFFLSIFAAILYAFAQFFDSQNRAKYVDWSNTVIVAVLISAIMYIVFFQLIGNLSTSLLIGTPIEVYSSVIASVAVLMLLVTLLVYLLSKSFNLKEWEAYLNIELSNLHLSFLMVLFVVGFFAFSESFILTLLGSYPIDLTSEYLKSTLGEVLYGMYDVTTIQACTTFMASIHRRLGDFALTRSYKVFPGLDLFNNILNVVSAGLLTAYGSISAQYIFIQLAETLLRPFLLPAGLVLRFFPPTRDAGAFLIAFAFGFQIVYPTVFVINAKALEDVFGVDAGEFYNPPFLVKQSICGWFKYLFYGALPSAVASVPGLGFSQGFITALFSETLLNLISIGEFMVILDSLAALSIPAVFSPAFAMMITLAFINSMSKFIVMRF